MVAACSALALLTACQAPGMKMDMKPNAKETPVQVGDLSLTLHALTPEMVQTLAVRPPATQALDGLLAEKPQPYRIGAQDILLFTVWDHPEITLALGQYRTDNGSGTVVDDDGSIFFPHVGRIRMGGLTIPEARAALTQQLEKVLQKPQVDVKVLAYRAQKVFVGGEVKAPAVYNITDVPFTLAEAVNRAGGFLPSSDDSRLMLTRNDQTWILDFQSLMIQGNRIGKIYLKDGDSLYVPNSLEAPVYLLGEVKMPGTMPFLHGNLSLANALTNAGGILGTSADARSIYVFRQGKAANAVEVFHLDARNPTSMVLADRFRLNPRDIVYVDAGTLVRFSRVMELLLPTVSAVTSAAVAEANVTYLRRAY